MKFAYEGEKMNKLYTLIGSALALSAGCAHEGIVQTGMVMPISAQERDIGPTVTVGGGHRATFPSGIELTSTVDYDGTEDVNGPVTLTSDNITARFGVGKKYGAPGSLQHVLSTNLVLRTENGHLSYPGTEEDLDSVTLFGMGVGYEARMGKGSVGTRVEALFDSENVDALLSVYAGYSF